MVLPVSNVLPPLEDHLGSVAQTFSNGLATLSERDQQALLNYVGDGLDAICRILEAGDVFVEIRAVRLAFLQGLAASFAQVLRKALDDQDTARKQLPVLSQGLDTLQMDFYMDTTAERSMRFRTIGSAVRSLRAISEILPGTEVTLRNPHNDLVIDAIPETFLAIIYGGTEVIEYFERTSKDLTKLVGYCLGDEDPDAALTVCIALLGHSDYFVRNGALSTIHKLFASFHPDGHRDMFEDIRTVSTQRSDQFLHLMTGIDALVEVLIAAPTQRAAATLELLRLGTQSEHSLQLLDSAFEGAAQRFGISDEHTLLDALLPDVLWMWPSDFEKVPWQLFGYDSNASFAADNRSVLLAKLLCSGNMEATKRFLSSDNAGALEQLRKGMPTILCHLLPIVFSEDDAADSHRAKEALEHLRALYGYEQFDNMIRQCKPAVIANLLRSAVGPSAGSTLSARWPRIHAAFSAMDALASDPLPVDSTPASPRRIEYDEVLRVIQWLYGIETMNCTPSMSESDLKEYFSPVLLQKVLQNLHECFKKLVFAEDKRALMVGGYRLLLAIAAPNIAMEPFLFRSTSQALITALPYPEICVCASSMLQYLLAPASTANKSQIGTNINWLVPALAQRAAAHANAGAMESVTACKRVITSCIQSAWRIDAKKAQLAVMQLEPEGMEDVRDALSQEGYSVMAAEAARPENVLALMALSGIGESGGFARVKYLRAALETTTLTQYLTGNQHQAEILVGRLLEILNAAQPSTHLALEAGHCLGRLAPLLRGRITKRLTSTSFNQGAATHGAHSHEIGTTLALRWLCKYLFHEDVFTVGVVIRTLHALFALPEGIEAFDALSPDDAEVMVMFKPASKRPMKHVETKKEYPVLQEDLLWAPFWKNSAVEYPLSKARSVLSDLAISLLRCCPPSSFFDRLGSIFERIPEFADVMLPFVVHSALEHELAVAGKKVRKRGVPSIRETLSSRVRALVAAPEALLPGVLASMLRVVEILRMHSHPTRKTPFDDNAWLDLDFFELAKSAVWNKSYASALVFLEVAEEATRRDWVPKMPMTPVPKRRDASMLNLLLEINRHIGDADGFEGVMFCLGQEIMVDGSDALVQSYEHNYAWDRILNVRETQLKVKVTPPDVGPAVQIGLMTAMSNMGLHHLLETYIKGIYPLSEGPISNSDIRELQYQSMWRNAHWDVQSLSLQAGAPGPNQQMYDAFDAYHKDDRENLNALTSEGIQNSIKGLSGLSLQNALNPFPYLRSLTINTELCELAVSDSSLPAFDRLLKIWDWRMTNLVSMQTFSELEPVLAARTSSMRCLIEKGRGAVSSDLIRAIYLGFCKHLLTYSQISRKAGSLQISQTALAHLDGLLEHMPHDMAGSFVDLRAAAKLEALKVLWKQGDQAVATRSLKRFLDLQRRTGQNGMSNGQDSVMLCQLGQWVAETRFEPPDLILSDYFEMAAHQAVWSDDNTLREEPHFHLAKFAEAQFQEIMANDSTEQIREHISYKQKEASACEALADQSAGKDPNLVKRYLHMRDKILLQIELDRAEEDRIAADKAKYLEMSAYNYVQAMVYGKKHFEVSVFRLCALWFGNVQNRRINEVIRQNLDTIPSSVWLVLMYQLSARLTALPPAHEQDFQHVLQLLLVKVVKDHPHHGLYHIIALRNGTQMGGPTARARQAEATPTVKAAHNVLTRLRQPNCLGDLVTRVEQLSTAYIELAFKKLTSAMIKENKTQPLDGRSRFAQIAKAGIDVPVATIEHQVRDDCQYDSLPLIAGFKGTFWVPGGVNLPRVVECAGSDGKIYTQLVKGNDDLRQDAVLSKIFSIMNVLLRQNLETRKRELAIRTYKVIPLAPRAGLVEWVRNTLPIGEYLTKAHPRYSDIDWHHSDCRTRMNEQFKKGSTDSKLAMYRQIEHNFRPVMRHFFFENFKDPLDWFERRLGYTRSVAVSSMAGFVVGLGDRHAQNILIDQGTAEVVHIDLGIAFDQGKLLAVSELVPFRLTRDIVDGMGMTGVEGAFRRGCEETMKVLRKDSEVLLTILDVFRYDPLYNW
ncbi:hypothetical protein HKX48_005948 [Thoreauomyces humboldtii]|nr:hypothetical protein HKX48_005948 [Thoreauomyces humboldtii]